VCPAPDPDRDATVAAQAAVIVQTHPELSLWAHTPLLRGAYVHAKRLPEAYEHPGTTRRLAALDAVATELGATRNQVVLAWLSGGDPPVTPIVGVNTPAQLDEALAGVSLVLTDAQRRRLDTPS
jgi:aryl-alcohol dehydrogenase-like predicted oxidoreductase